MPPRPAATRTPATPPTEALRIQKYPNRRLYDRTTSRHLTHEQLHGLVASGRRVEINDSRTGLDITNVVLAQVMLEHDPLKLAAFPPEVFHLLIRANERMMPALQQTLLQSIAQTMRTWFGWQEQMRALMPAGTSLATPLDWMLAAMPPTPGDDAAPKAPDRRTASTTRRAKSSGRTSKSPSRRTGR